MSKHPIPEECLSQHVAILGKTGSGKTSTEKLAVEQVVSDGFRVCVLDTVKSDWWGLTSSADGKKPGLPFKILGGPHGHVPLHSSAGAVIGALVGAGKLPLSIIDMADFEPGGLQRFFVDFAPALMRNMRGVLYLVIEEAHELAPKERSGFGAENMAIHWAKKLATAGRSKGIRLIVATQRVQSLHNAVLGSCETLIAHRLTTPADQDPILKWLKGNADKETVDSVAGSLSSLPTGTGWLCSGEARIFKQVAFPKFKTYDNAATPLRDGPEVKVKTAPVDQDELRAIIGDAVAEAVENDPKRLKARIAELEKAVKGTTTPKPDPEALQKVRADGYAAGRADGLREALQPVHSAIALARTGLDQLAREIGDAGHPVARPVQAIKLPPQDVKLAPERVKLPPSEGVTAPQQRILDAMAKLESLGVGQIKKGQVGAFAGASPKSSAFQNNVSRLRTLGLLDYPRPGEVSLTAAGTAAAAYPDAPPTLNDLHRAWLNLLSGPQARIVECIIGSYPESMSKAELSEKAGASALSSAFQNNVSALRSLGLLDYPEKGYVIATDILFPSGVG